MSLKNLIANRNFLLHDLIVNTIYTYFFIGYVLSSNLQITGLNFSNHTSENKSTSQGIHPSTTTTTTTGSKKLDESSRSEIYKMHNNGLILLHAQRATSGSEAKKSELIDTVPSGSINYHVRKRGKINETNTVVENEKHLESKLGNLPQVHHKRSIKPTKSRKLSKDNVANPSNVPFLPEIKRLCNKKFNSKKWNCHRRSHKSNQNWKSIFQGEDINGSHIRKSKVNPEKLNHTEEKINLDLFKYDVPNNSNTLNLNSEKNERLKRAFSFMNFVEDENPIYDNEQPEALVKQAFKRHKKHNKKHLIMSDIHGEQFEAPISRIPKINDIIEPLKSLDVVPRFPYLQTFQQFPRFPVPSNEVFEPIPGIPKIKPLKPNFHLSGLKRNFHGIFEVRSLPRPTDIAPIIDIPPSTDIPLIKPLPSVNHFKTVNGVQRHLILNPENNLHNKNLKINISFLN